MYYISKKYSTTQIGLLEALLPLSKVVSGVFWAVLADKCQAKKGVALFTSAMSVIILCMLAFPGPSSSFESVLALSVASSMFTSPSILTAWCLDLLGNKHKHLYGRYRLLTATSWGLGSFIMGVITDLEGGHFELNFALFATFTAIGIVLMAAYIPSKTKADLAINADELQIGDVVTAFLKFKSLVFFLEISVMGAAVGLVERLLFTYVEASPDDGGLGGSTTLCGLTVAVNVLIELPIFFNANAFFRLLGRDNMLVCAMLAYAVRAYGYTLLTHDTRNYILLLESLHGVTFGLLWTSAVDFVSDMFPPGWNSTAQGILLVFYGCVGCGMGSLLGGRAMDAYGYRSVYEFAGVVVAAMTVTHFIAASSLKASNGYGLFGKVQQEPKVNEE